MSFDKCRHILVTTITIKAQAFLYRFISVRIHCWILNIIANAMFFKELMTHLCKNVIL